MTIAGSTGGGDFAVGVSPITRAIPAAAAPATANRDDKR